MSLETGGRCDKIGNQYENRYLAKLLLRLVEESIYSIEVEQMGEEGKGVEYITQSIDGSRIYYQCKASNNTKNYWSVSDLNNLNIFKNARLHIEASTENEYHFISPLPYGELDDLCNRARMTPSAEILINNQLTNTEIKKVFSDCEKYFNLSRNNPEELSRLVYLLSRCYFELVPDTEDATSDLNSSVGHCFVGNASTARELLENCVNTNKWFGLVLTSTDIIDYMKNNGYVLREYGQDPRISPRINTINHTYWDNYSPIDGNLFPRKETTEIIQHIKNGYSIILHGKAGVGKSGVIEETIKHLEEENIIYLRIKLDKYPPKDIADKYGESLGLPESPVHCLKKLSAGKPCVLILDQLDSLRWTNSHSSFALDVCKEMFNQVSYLNKHDSAKISVLCVTRTFDYKNDTGIKNLFTEPSQSEMWKAIELDRLSCEETKQIVGNTYESLSRRLQELLQTPSTLYIWSQLEEKDKQKNVTTVDKMMDSWWNQIIEKSKLMGFSAEEVNNFITRISNDMNQNGMFYLLKRLYGSYTQIIKALISNGILGEQNGKIFFIHQSFLDYFLATEAINKVFLGNPLVDIIGDKNNQTPNLRYRLLSILGGLYDADESKFLEQSTLFIESNNIRFYYKCAIFETISQKPNPSQKIVESTKKYLSYPKWHDFVYYTVFMGNSYFIKNLNPEKSSFWISDEGLNLLRSINTNNPDFVVDSLSEHCSKNIETDEKIYRSLCHDVSDDSPNMYEMRTQLYEAHPTFLVQGWYSFYGSYKQTPDRFIDYLILLLKNCSNDKIANIHLPDLDDLKDFISSNSELLINKLYPLLCDTTNGLTPDTNKKMYYSAYDKWAKSNYNEGHIRKIVEIVKSAMQLYGKKHTESFWKLINKDNYEKSLIRNEIILSTLENIHENYANQTIEWMLQSFPTRIIDYTGTPTDGLLTTKNIFIRFTPLCSTDLYKTLEKTIFDWKESPEEMRENYKDRLEYNKNDTTMGYWAYWGNMQKALLPYLYQERLSKDSKELIAVLKRNKWVKDIYHRSPWGVGSAMSVVSPIDKYAEQLPVKTWLDIIKTPPERMKNKLWKETNSKYVEATPYAFSSTLRRVAEKNPNKYAKLALLLPDGCDKSYVTALMSSLKNQNEQGEFADFELTCNIIRRFSSIKENEIKIIIADIIEKRANEQWPEDIIELIKAIALTPENHSDFPDDKNEAHSLLNKMYNTTRGTAIKAISALLWEHPHMLDSFKDTIVTLINDEEEYVKFATMYCAVCYYNTEPNYATSCFKNILEKTKSILINEHSWILLSKDYSNNQNFYRNILFQACNSPMKDLAEKSARYLCAIAIWKADEKALEYILKNVYPLHIAEKVLFEAVATFNHDEHYEIRKNIILHILSHYDVDAKDIDSSFFKEKIIFEQDHDFVLQILKSKNGVKIISSFLKYLSEADINIICLEKIISEISLHISDSPKTYYLQRDIAILIQCIIQLYDKGNENPTIKETCLDCWDYLFQNNYTIVQPIGDMLDKFI